MMTDVEVLIEEGGGDKLDAGELFNFAFGGRRVPSGIISTQIDSDRYNMHHLNRGHCIIFNNRVFESHTGLPERRGTDVDADKLYLRFRELDFAVEVHQNLSVKNILKKIEEAGRRDFTNDDCFVCCVLSHGDEGVLFGKDGKYSKDLLTAPFKADACPSLAGKPKIFFIQACQGDKLDDGVIMLQPQGLDFADAGGALKLSTHADFLVAYSTVPGYYSWRNTTNGSWFVQGLCSVLEKEGTTNDLLSMLTNANRFVAYGFESCVPTDRTMDQKKQVPFVTHTLTRKIYFPRH